MEVETILAINLQELVLGNKHQHLTNSKVLEALEMTILKLYKKIKRLIQLRLCQACVRKRL